MRFTAVVIGLCLGLCLSTGSLVGAEEGGSGSELELHQNVKRLGDFDAMDREHVIRFLVPFSKTFYFLDKAVQKGLTYEFIKLFEKEINKSQKKGHVKIKAVIIPTQRDRLLDDLAAGLGDVAAGNLTITPQRLNKVDFADPFFQDAREVMVSGRDVPAMKTLFDLSGKTVYTRRSSSYHESLLQLNQTLKATGKRAMTVKFADEYLEDEDLLEMVNAGLIPMVVVDRHKAVFWTKVFANITLQESIVLRKGGKIAWAIRKNSPLLKEKINHFVKRNKKGTLHFNMLKKRYLHDTGYITNNTSQKEMEKFRKVVKLLQKYAGQYSFDWIMIAALAYQESGLDQSKKSRAGAVGIMQVLPSTAADPNVNVSDIHKLDRNIHAGTKYLRFMADRYYAGQGINNLNRHLFAFASYNAGPARVARLRKEAAKKGLDRNIWFNNVELVAARRIGRETVQYVSNIYKYYIAYRLIVKTMVKKDIGMQLLKEHHQQ